MVTEIFEEYVKGLLIGKQYHCYPIPHKVKVPHNKYNSEWVRNIKRFVSDKPRLEVTVDGIKIWNTLKLVAVDHPEDFWRDEDYIQRYQIKKRCRSVLEGVARKPKQAARKTVWRKILKQQNWGNMRKNKIQKTDHSPTKK